ncbi:phospholipid-binding protein [Nodularia harveyana UHCC-0300]|uniref:Phospholipid-binding protein n=1 Tax=Nodularia harveyana UHCC-0300 TaxID=2974287 RepID=A0ABU5UCW8_9CYAN|nr:phospholipid-binding protein [Nodularia harveyana]MEA5581389.1 phospholipid-binding protein [Nodularia harveyana UHCC-0300]
MTWLKRLFGMEKPQNAQVNPQPQQPAPTAAAKAAPATTQSIPPERLGLNGEYDQSGLAKRVALAFDENAELTDVDTLWVAQTSNMVVLKGKVPSEDILNKMIAVAAAVNGAKGVNTDEVSIG